MCLEDKDFHAHRQFLQDNNNLLDMKKLDKFTYLIINKNNLLDKEYKNWYLHHLELDYMSQENIRME